MKHAYDSLKRAWDGYYGYLTDEQTKEFAVRVLSELREEDFYAAIEQAAKENDYDLGEIS